jgi:hypothetical protein
MTMNDRMIRLDMRAIMAAFPTGAQGPSPLSVACLSVACLDGDIGLQYNNNPIESWCGLMQGTRRRHRDDEELKGEWFSRQTNRGEEFPVPTDEFPDRPKNFPVLAAPGICAQRAVIAW